jgi:hypothetical protein
VTRSRRRAGALVGIAVALAAPACGATPREPTGPLAWAGRPTILSQAGLPDRVLRGTVRNDGVRPLSLVAKDLRLLDRDGRRVPGVATFIAGYAHSNYPPTREPRLPEAEERRLGRRALLRPGESGSLTLAWRESPGARRPVELAYGEGRLPIPPVLPGAAGER